jgi:hypothetical protein
MVKHRLSSAVFSIGVDSSFKKESQEVDASALSENVALRTVPDMNVCASGE